MDTTQRDDWAPQLLTALVIGVATAVATLTSSDLSVPTSALLSVLASVAGWATARAMTHGGRRTTNLLLAAALVAVATVVVMSGGSEPCAPKGVACFVGEECERFSVYAQNRFDPLGAAVRPEPRREAPKIGSFAPNELVSVDGWVRTQSPYPHNSPSINSDIWFHLSDDGGWVAFAAVRADPTRPAVPPDDTDPGRVAPAPAECSGTFRSNPAA